MTELDNEELLRSIEERIYRMERQVFGDEINSKIQQKRKIPDELVQLNSQIHRSVSNREDLTKLMKQIEQVMEFLVLESSSQLLGTEAKANAILAAEPLIRQMYEILKRIDIEKIQEAMNSESIRSLTSLHGQLAKLKVVQMEQEENYDDFCSRIKDIESAISILVSNMSDA